MALNLLLLLLLLLDSYYVLLDLLGFRGLFNVLEPALLSN